MPASATRPQVWRWVWTLSLLVASTGLLLLAYGQSVPGIGLWIAGASPLALRSVVHAGRRSRAQPPWSFIGPGTAMLGMALFFAGNLLLDLHPEDAGRQARIAVAVTGAQIWIAALGLHPLNAGLRYPRLLVPTIGHGIVLCATAYVLAHPDPALATSGLAYGVGFTLLLLHAYWTERTWARSQADIGLRGWEPWLLLAVGVTAFILFLHSRIPFPDVPMLPELRLVEAIGRLGFLLAIALLADRPPAPAPMRSPHVQRRDFLIEAIAGAILVNAFALSWFLLAPWSLDPVLGAFSLWVLLSVAFEQAALIDGWRRIQRERSEATPDEPMEPIEALVVAHNEARILPRSVLTNLHNHPQLRILIVASRDSTDDTVLTAQVLAKRHPRRVRYLVVGNGSKANDLAEAWPHTTTEWVLTLDADEILAPDALRWALHHARRDPSIGIVQGRKVSRSSDARPLSRFIAAERRFSTRFDHVFHAGVFGSAHFAGGAALVRRRVPGDAGGWRARTLVEDIEMTMRIHLRTSWRIQYEPRMLAWEADPATAHELVRQRTRWGRGWNQVHVHFLREIFAPPSPTHLRRRIGLVWQYMNSFSAAWAVLMPTFLLLWATGRATFMPVAANVGLLLLTMPSRFLAYLASGIADPVIPVPRTLRRRARLLMDAYGWIGFGWMLQLRCLYLELSEAPRIWYGTRKEAASAESPGVAAPTLSARLRVGA